MVEVSAPKGYVLDSTPIPFSITQDNTSTETGVTVVMVKAYDMPQKGIIKINKIGDVLSTVKKSDDKYIPVYEESSLTGATFEIYALEDIVTNDGTKRYSKGDLIDEITTDENGVGESKELYLGKYSVIEKMAPKGFIKTDEPITIELTYAGQEIDVTSESFEHYNERQRVNVNLLKTMEKDKIFSLGLDNEVTSVIFGLYANEKITAKDGTSIPKDGLISIASPDEDGKILFDCDLPISHNFYVKEIETNKGYILDDTKYEFSTGSQDDSTDVINIDINNGESIENKLIYGSVMGYKTDRETGAVIAGATFALFSNDEINFTKENAILTATTDDDGIFVFDKIPLGEWIVAEISPAEGYLHTNDIHHITIDGDGDVITINAQNDKIPEIHTMAQIDGKKEVEATDEYTLVDTVEYQHLIPGVEYTLFGTLMDKSTGEKLLIDGEEYTSSTTFTPESPSGNIDVNFTFDARYIKEDTDIVVFESLFRDYEKLTEHEDIDDEGQTVKILVPEIGTSASVDNEKEICATETFTLTDTVEYKNLTVGKEYTLTGILMNKTIGDALIIDGEEVTATTTFIPNVSSGVITVEFTFDSKYIKEDTEIVAFESLYKDDFELAVHADINDENQTVTVHVPKIKTSASIEGQNEVYATEKFKLTDTVQYENLTPGKKYKVVGILMDKSTNEALLIDGKKITAITTFTPETSNGSINVIFSLDARNIKTQTDIVVFEVLYRDGTEIAKHEDITDTGQTVRVKIPQIGTEASVNGEKKAKTGEEITIDDKIVYINLTPGKEYKVKGVLMNKSTGKKFKVNGKAVTSSVTFIPDSSTGETVVSFSFDSSKLDETTDIVVFETLYRNKYEIASHEDIDDEGQTVQLVKPVTVTTSSSIISPNTGDNTNIRLLISIGGVSILGVICISYSLIKNKKRGGNK